MSKAKQLILSAIPGIPLVYEGDNLAEMVYKAVLEAGLGFEDGDVIVLAQKIVSKAEGRLVNLLTVKPSARAIELAEYLDKRPNG